MVSLGTIRDVGVLNDAWKGKTQFLRLSGEGRQVLRLLHGGKLSSVSTLT